MSTISTRLRNIWQRTRQSMLIFWYQHGYYNRMARMFSRQSDYKKLTVDEFPFLYFLISAGNSIAVEAMLNKCLYLPYIMTDDNNPMKVNPLIYAYLEGRFLLAQIIEKYGADIQVLNSQGQNLLHLSAIYQRQDAFIIALNRKHGNTPLHYACRVASLKMIELLLQLKCKKICNKLYQYAVHMAIQSRNKSALDLLKADITLSYPQFSPIHSAARSQSPQMFNYVIKIKPVLLNLKDYQGMTALHHAVTIADIDMVKRICLQSNLLIDQTDNYGNTALHLAILIQSQQIVRILVQLNANLDIPNEDQITPAEYALQSKDQGIIRYIKGFTFKSKTLQRISVLKY